MGVSRDIDGWTIVTISGDSRVIYVSSTGNDANNGLSSLTPKATIAAGIALLRGGFPDWLLLKKGDSWISGAINSGGKSGRSVDEPMLIASYGTGARPLIKTGPDNGFYTGSTAINYVFVIGIKFYADTRDPNSPSYVDANPNNGFRLLAGGDTLLIEDCEISFYQTNIVISDATHSNVTIRRNVIVDAYATAGHSQGMICGGVEGLTIQENVFDHNGWNETVVGAGPTVFNHNSYITVGCTGVVLTGNIIARASSHGSQMREGGEVSDNLFLDNPIALDFGLVNGGDVQLAGGVIGSMTGNVVIGSRDIAGSPRGNGFDVGNIKPASGVVISGNLFVGDADSLGAAINVTDGDPAVPPDTGTNDLLINGNIVYGWGVGLLIDPAMEPGGSGGFSLTGLVVTGNQFQQITDDVLAHGPPFSSDDELFSSNHYYSPASASTWFTVDGVVTSFTSWKTLHEAPATSGQYVYVDSSRDMGSYNSLLGGTATLAAFLAEARLQSKDNWRTQYMAMEAIAYMQAGFVVVSTGEGMSTSRRNAILSLSPKFLSPFDEASGNFADVTGNGKTFVASVVGIAYQNQSGFDGPIAQFDGVVGYAGCASNPFGGSTVPAAFSIVFEIIKTGAVSGTILINLGRSTDHAKSLVQIYGAGGSTLGIFCANDANQSFDSGSPVDAGIAGGALKLITLTYDAAAVDGKRWKFYSEATEIDSMDNVLGTTTINEMFIAAQYAAFGTYAGAAFGNVAGFDRALTLEEIITIVNGIASGGGGKGMFQGIIGSGVF